MKNWPYIFSFILLFSGCARLNAPVVKQTYHDITGHYNAYFNAKELYNAAIQAVNESGDPDYDEILSLYPHKDPEQMSGQAAGLATAIDKATRSIQLHEISNWTDDAFLLIGKSHFVQGNYDEALKSFRYITSKYKQGVDGRSDKKKKKQRRGKAAKKLRKKLEPKVDKEGNLIQPKDKLFVHEAARHEALVWIVKAFTAKGDFEEASAVLSFIRTDPYFTRNLNRDLSLAEANLFIARGDYDLGAQSLNQVLDDMKSQKKRARFQFITAQLHEKTGNLGQAVEMYKASIKKNNDFEMSFMAQLKLIQLARKGNFDKKEAEKRIARMLRDRKFKDFHDQLWYEKAMWALQDNDREEAISFLKKSLEANTTNEEQKALSHLAIARVYYQDENYIPSQANYDSTMVLIDDTWEDWDEVNTRSRVLGELVERLNLITTNDSLLALAQLDEAKRESYLRVRAEKEIDDELAAKEAIETLAVTEETRGNRGGGGNTWYFDNPSLVKQGAAQFQTVWGDRPLVDNWRRKAAIERNELANTEDSDFINPEKDYYGAVESRVEAMLADLPLTAEAQEKAHEEIKTAHYEAAEIYKNDLDNIPKAIELYEDLLERYPDDNPYEAEVLYNLFLLYDLTGNESRAELYKNRIFNEYPDSRFAKIIRNPDYADELQRIEAQAAEYYEATYSLYEAGDYNKVVTRCQQAQNRFGGSPIQAKFALLEALAQGQVSDRTQLIASLDYVISTYPGTEEEKRALEIRSLLDGSAMLDTQATGSQATVSDSTLAQASTSDAKLQKKINRIQSGDNLARSKEKSSGIPVPSAEFSTADEKGKSKADSKGNTVDSNSEKTTSQEKEDGESATQNQQQQNRPAANQEDSDTSAEEDADNTSTENKEDEGSSNEETNAASEEQQSGANSSDEENDSPTEEIADNTSTENQEDENSSDEEIDATTEDQQSGANASEEENDSPTEEIADNTSTDNQKDENSSDEEIDASEQESETTASEEGNEAEEKLASDNDNPENEDGTTEGNTDSSEETKEKTANSNEVDSDTANSKPISVDSLLSEGDEYSLSQAEENALEEAKENNASLETDSLSTNTSSSVETEAPNERADRFETTVNSPYYFILAVPDSAFNTLDSLQDVVRQFANKQPSSLQVYPVDFFKGGYHVILARPIQGLAATRKFYEAFTTKHSSLRDACFYVSLLNYTVLYNKQDIPSYLRFFKSNY